MRGPRFVGRRGGLLYYTPNLKISKTPVAVKTTGIFSGNRTQAIATNRAGHNRNQQGLLNRGYSGVEQTV
ncbi:MAG: hypothetical protein H6Q61_785 [Firmicutes bacterium]|nr:hypothetical protein [Bacillota bacterium]